ncbi:MAG TPA: class I SAM-dependent methyltransferase [bacterium]|nr:class I SAM-dependent methyltransferase [bacterium]
MTTMYAALSSYYDDIFPLDGEMADFLIRHLPRGPVLDIGCATGSMACHLAQYGFAPHGFDLDPAMIAAATARAQAAQLPATFAVRDMRDTAASGAPGSFAGAYCVGNSLVHAPGRDAIDALLRATATLLAPGGALALQIINYDRVLDNGVTTLPVRDTGALLFERQYQCAGDLLRFTTRLTIRRTGEVITDSVMLCPLRAATLHDLLAGAGFRDIKLLGEFGEMQWSRDGYLTIALART